MKEAEALTGVAVTGHDTAREAAKKPIERGVSAVAIQAGGAGNLLVRPDGREQFLPRLPVDSVDAAGAGDAFAAALAVMLAGGRPLEQAGPFANAAAALATTAPRPPCPHAGRWRDPSPEMGTNNAQRLPAHFAGDGRKSDDE